jgi:hypothetical protein
VTNTEGEQYIAPCKYLDDTHFEINGTCYHIHQFAGLRERNSLTVQPNGGVENINGYRVYEKIFVGPMNFISAFNPNAQPNKRYSTWQKHCNRRVLLKTQYFQDKSDARTDLLRRADCERRGIPYIPVPAEKNARRRDDAR